MWCVSRSYGGPAACALGDSADDLTLAAPKSVAQGGSLFAFSAVGTRFSRRRNSRRYFSPNRLALAGIVALYLLLSLSFSWLTPAGEANDELDHVQYVEHIVGTGSLPRVSLINGDESHQPPLFYLVGSAWQKLWGIPPFELNLRGIPNPLTLPRPMLSHVYTQTQHRDAIRLHVLRLLSVVFGLGTVLLTYLAGLLATRRAAIGLAAAAFVAVLPKQLVVSSAVTNDSLVILLGTLSLVLLLGWLRKMAKVSAKISQSGKVVALLLGMSLGLAVLTKFTALPLVVVSLAIMVSVVGWRARAFRSSDWLNPLALTVGFSAVSGWWFIRNKILYGQFLATTAANNYLKAIKGLIVPVGWFNSDRFFHFLPHSLFSTAWYDGGWNQFVIPRWMNIGLALLAAISVLLLFRSVAIRHERVFESYWGVSALVGAALSGLLALVIIAKDTHQAEGRVTYVGLTAFAILLTVGMESLVRRCSGRWWGGLLMWPAALLGVDLYVFASVVWPFRGL